MKNKTKALSLRITPDLKRNLEAQALAENRSVNSVCEIMLEKGTSRFVSSREQAFVELKNHEWLGKVFKRLTAAEIAFARAFLQENKPLNKGAFQTEVNRLFLDKPKPKNHMAIMELLSCANSRFK